MKNIGVVILLVLGIVEIAYGMVFGRLRIYAHEVPFAHAIQLDDKTPEQRHVFNQYIDLFKDQCGIVALFGWLTIGAAVPIWLVNRKKPTP